MVYPLPESQAPSGTVAVVSKQVMVLSILQHQFRQAAESSLATSLFGRTADYLQADRYCKQALLLSCSSIAIGTTPFASHSATHLLLNSTCLFICHNRCLLSLMCALFCITCERGYTCCSPCFNPIVNINKLFRLKWS